MYPIEKENKERQAAPIIFRSMSCASTASVSLKPKGLMERSLSHTTPDLLRRVSRKGSVNSAVSHFTSLDIGCQVMQYMLAHQAHVAYADAFALWGMTALLLLSIYACSQDETAQQPVKR